MGAAKYFPPELSEGLAVISSPDCLYDSYETRQFEACPAD
jgi:hypothetical protein